jgi:hypothetical protein
MRTSDRPERHPLCTCPELTWDAATGRANPPDLDACRARAFGGINPHPVIEAMVIETRPQDWIPAAEWILRERGAWRRS